MDATMMHTPMTYSVFPMCDQNMVIVFHVESRSAARARLTTLSSASE